MADMMYRDYEASYTLMMAKVYMIAVNITGMVSKAYRIPDETIRRLNEWKKKRGGYAPFESVGDAIGELLDEVERLEAEADDQGH